MERSQAAFELIRGPYRSGKTSRLIRELLKLKETDALARVLVLVPSARYGKILKSRIAEALQESEGIRAILGLDIQPFYQACRNFLSKEDAEPHVIPEELRAQAMANILAQLGGKGDLSGLAKISGFHGTASAIIELIDELQRAALSPEELIERLSATASSDSRLQELALCYRSYTAFLNESGLFDQKMLALKARQVLFCDDKVFWDLVLIDGFDRVSKMQAQVFAGFARHAARSIMSFDYLAAGGEGDNQISGEARTHFCQSASDYRWKDKSYQLIISHLNPKITEIDRQEVQGPRFMITRILDPFLEMKELCRHLKRAIIERKLKPSELYVALRSPDSYQDAIAYAFNEAGIPYFIDGSAQVKETPLWQFIDSVISCSYGEFKRKALIDILRSPFFNSEALPLNFNEIRALDRDSYQRKLVSGANEWKDFLRRKYNQEFTARICRFIDELNFAGEETKEEFCDAKSLAGRLEDLLEKYMKLPASKQNLRSANAQEERETIKALRRSLRVLIMQEELLGESPMKMQQFLERLKLLMESSSFARARPQEEAVTVSSPELLPNVRIKELYICGMIEGDFPKQHKARGFLASQQLGLWESFSVDISNPRQEAGFERALFYSLCERASSFIYFSLPQFKDNSEETTPSFFLSEIVTRLPELQAPFAGSLQLASSAKDLLSGWLWHDNLDGAEKLAGNLPAGREREEMLALINSLQEPLTAIRIRSNAELKNQYNGYLADFFKTGILSFAEHSDWTASKINDYGKCPFRFWASHVLDLQPRLEAEPGLNPALRGQLYHKVLELFFRALQEKELLRANSSIDSEAVLESVFEPVFLAAIDWLEIKTEFKPGPYWKQEQKDLRFRLKRFIRRELLRIAQDECAFVPQIFELEFGGKSPDSYPGLAFESEHGLAIRVSGKIDRVDKIDCGKATELRIIDYKSGSRRITTKEALNGTNLQLPLYALALEEAVFPGQRVRAAEYLSISSAESAGKLNFESEKHRGLKKLARDYLFSYAEAAAAGDFSVSPRSRQVCKDCMHKTICRINDLALLQKEDPDAESD